MTIIEAIFIWIFSYLVCRILVITIMKRDKTEKEKEIDDAQRCAYAVFSLIPMFNTVMIPMLLVELIYHYRQKIINWLIFKDNV